MFSGIFDAEKITPMCSELIMPPISPNGRKAERCAEFPSADVEKEGCADTTKWPLTSLVFRIMVVTGV